MTSALDTSYQTQRRRLAAAVTRRAGAVFSALYAEPEQAISQIVPIVQGGQRMTVTLVSAYMTAKTAQTTGIRPIVTLDSEAYLSVRNGVTAQVAYERPFSVLTSALVRTGDHTQALASAEAQVSKLATTDLQLSQARAARDWMTAAPSVVGYRRVLTGPGPHCPLCELASTRTYRKSDLMPIHEHCGCTVVPLYGTEPVASVGTTVRVEDDPEIGPRLMADSWSSVGPRLFDPAPAATDLGTLAIAV